MAMQRDVKVTHPPEYSMPSKAPEEKEASPEELKELQNQLAEMTVEDATASTLEYYMENKDKSYDIEPGHTHRGRAFIVTMTKAREGWKEDTLTLHRLFTSLKIHVQHLFDPSKQMLREKLSLFAKDDANKQVDCVFVVFMGHGMGQGNNCYLQTKDEYFEIWSNSSQIFGSSDCNLHQKPKTLLAQMCRTETLADTPRDHATGVDHYVLVFASQPGQEALREAAGPVKGSHFIQHLTDIMHEESHCCHMESIIKKVYKVFKRASHQRSHMQTPQWICTISDDVNLFPGITSERLRETGNHGQHSKQHNPNLNKICPVAALDSKSEPDSAEEMEHTGRKPLLINLEIKVEPDILHLQKATENHIRNILDSDLRGVSSFLSKELAISIKLIKTSSGSVTLFLDLDLTKVEIIKHLCQTGVFANVLEAYIVTKDLLQRCKVRKILMQACVNESSYLEIMASLRDIKETVTPIESHLGDHVTNLNDDVAFSVLTADENVQWYKNGEPLKEDARIRVSFWAGKSDVYIRDLRVEDSGLYTCTHRSLITKLLTMTKCRLVVTGFSRVRDVEIEAINSFQISVTWQAAVGTFSGYRVYYSLLDKPYLEERNEDIPKSKKSSIVTGLSPGARYRVSVVTFHEDDESDESPTEGVLITMPDIHFMVLEQSSSELETHVKLESIIPTMNEQHMLSQSDMSLLQATKKKKDQIKKFIHLLKMQDRGLFHGFIRLLISTNQKQLADKLQLRLNHLSKFILPESGVSITQEEEATPILAWHEDDDQTVVQVFPSYKQTREMRVSEFVSSFPPGMTERAQYAESIPSLVPTDTDSGFTGDTSTSTASQTVFGTVIRDHKPTDELELHIRKGDVVIVSDREGSLWRGQVGGQTGLFPAECVQVHGAKGHEISADEEVKTLIAALKDRETQQGPVEDEVSKLRERILQLSIKANNYVDEKLEVCFNKWQELVIWKRDETQPGRPELAADRWRAVTHMLLPQHVLGVVIGHVNLGQATQGVLDFVATCTELNVLVLSNVGDGTVNNQYILGGLRNALNKLTKVVGLHVWDTPLGGKWGDVLSSLSGPQLRLLTLVGNKLGGCGEQVAACLARLPLLLYLDLTESGLSGEGLVAVLTSLPHCCPHLVVLLLENNDLSHMEDLLGQVVEKLPKLRIMTVGNCKIKSQSFSSILDKAKNIEFFEIDSNAPLLHPPSQEQAFVSLVEQRTTLRYLRVSAEQLSPGARERVGGLLRGRGGGLVVGGSQDPRWQQYQAYIYKIRDECFKKFT